MEDPAKHARWQATIDKARANPALKYLVEKTIAEENQRFDAFLRNAGSTTTWYGRSRLSFIYFALVDAGLLPTGPFSWTEKDHVITFSVTSDGTTGEGWRERLGGMGYKMFGYSPLNLLYQIEPTNGVTTEVAILKGSFFDDEHRLMANVRAEATKRGYTKPHPEVACLIRAKFTYQEILAMGLLEITVMHEPLDDADHDPCVLGTGKYGGKDQLTVFSPEPMRPNDQYDVWHGFAFAASPATPSL